MAADRRLSAVSLRHAADAADVNERLARYRNKPDIYFDNQYNQNSDGDEIPWSTTEDGVSGAYIHYAIALTGRAKGQEVWAMAAMGFQAQIAC
eukprot:gene14319-45164_t